MARNFLVSLTLGLLIVTLVACASTNDQTSTPEEGSSAPALPTSTDGIPVTGADLVNTRWRLVSFGEQGAVTQVIDGTEVTLEFEANGQAGGMASCNPYGAQYSVQEDVLTFQQFVVTHTTCVVEDAMQQESRYLQALDEAGRFELSGDQLTIHYGESEEVLNFVRVES